MLTVVSDHLLVEMDDEDQVGGGKRAKGIDLGRVSSEESIVQLFVELDNFFCL